MPSPSLEQMVAEDSDASLKTVSQRTWQNPLIAGPRPIPDTSPTVPASAMGGHQRKPSIRSNIARYSAGSQLSRQLSTNSMASSLDESGNNRLSIPRLGTADRVSIRSVSSVTSLRSDTAVKKIITPRKVSRCSTTVSENGSPAERQKINVLRDISGNACTPSRQPSNATQFSSRSSNGNPFQWDSVPLQKPSALKGSPNARKGHRRQNCVRISTLTPQILGPPPSRPTSPSIMHGIEEEPLDASSDNFMGGLPFVSNQSRLSRPPSATVFAPHLRISTLRASLTSASPVLSSWTTFQEPGIASQPSDSALSASASSGFTGNRSGSRHSGQSSNLSIPSFPSPSKTTVTAVQRDQPVPEFHFTRPSTDEPSFDFGWDRGSPPRFDGSVADNADLPSSPPLPVSKVEEYDPAWPIIDAPRRDGSQEYDPASPTFVQSPKDTDHTSPLASTVTFSDDTARYRRPVSYGEEYQPESPPCSPKTVPQGFDSLPPSTPASRSGSSTPQIDYSNEPLTSAIASTIMARIQTHRPNVTFPGAPILPPPIDDSPVPFPLNTARNRSLSTHSTYLQPQRPAPAPPIPTTLLPGPQKPPSPIGPRSPPAKSLAKQIVTLRRMNSEMDASTSHQTRRYVHGLAREPSPLLPWIGSPDPSESCNDMFDFDFGRDARGGAEEAGEGEVGEGEAPASALDNVDLSDIERRLEGALAGFEVPVAVEEQEREREEGECESPVWARGCAGEEEDEDERSSSVWEDGEKFWDRTSLSTIPGSSPSDADKARAAIQTPRMYAIENHGFGSRWARMRSPSVMVTPRSLYDADGFLKT
ncbi:hypothetical protein WHR41_01595 [Cladosporium halotolerans]|uniref:Uncharacterized protein n=1 Tax=Cladosporium halotolerans TaxID=1052096 RepID=A0AB34KYX7_9PEZI